MPIQTCTEVKDRYVRGYTEFGVHHIRLQCSHENMPYTISLLAVYAAPPCSKGQDSVAQVLNGPGCLYKLAQGLRIDMSMGIPSLA